MQEEPSYTDNISILSHYIVAAMRMSFRSKSNIIVKVKSMGEKQIFYVKWSHSCILIEPSILLKTVPLSHVNAKMLRNLVSGIVYTILHQTRRHQPHPVEKLIDSLKEYNVTFLNSPDDLDSAIATLSDRRDDHPIYLGIDLEMHTDKKKGPHEGKISLVQIANEEVCFLYAPRPNEHLPPSLRALLHDDTIIKFGVAMVNDKKALREQQDIDIKGAIDIAEEYGPTFCYGNQIGLEKLTNMFLNKTLGSSENVSTSFRLGLTELTDDERDYAALDAVAALMIGKQAILKRNEEEIKKLSLKINAFCNWSTPEVHGTVLTRFESEEAFHADLNKK